MRYLLILLFLTFIFCEKNNSKLNHHKIEVIQVSPKIKKKIYYLNSIIKKTEYYTNDKKNKMFFYKKGKLDSMYFIKYLNDTILESFCKLKNKKLGLFECSIYKNYEPYNDGLFMLNNKNEMSPILWNNFFFKNGKIKSRVFHYYISKNYVRAQLIENYGNDGHLFKKKSHTIKFERKDNKFILYLISCCVSTKSINLLTSKDKFETLESKKNNIWEIKIEDKYIQADNTIEGYISIKDSMVFKDSIFKELDKNKSYFKINILANSSL